MEHSKPVKVAASISRRRMSKSQKEELRSRMSRLLWENEELIQRQNSFPTISVSALSHYPKQISGQSLGSPIAVAAVISAGLIGVTIFAVILLGAWLRSRRSHKESKGILPMDVKEIEHIEIDPSPLVLVRSLGSVSTSTMVSTNADSELSSNMTFYTAREVSTTRDYPDDDDSSDESTVKTPQTHTSSTTRGFDTVSSSSGGGSCSSGVPLFEVSLSPI